MRWCIMSYQRPKLQVTINSIPDKFLSQVELWVRPEEYKLYKKESYASKLKKIHVWENHMDFMPKKRKFFCQQVGKKDDFMMMDDDVRLRVWNTKEQRYVSGHDDPRLFEKYFCDVFPGLFEKYDHVAAANQFMANPYIKAHGLEKVGTTGPVVWGFAKGAACDLKFSRTFGYQDMYIPWQVQNATKGKTIVHYGIAFGHDNRPELEATGIGHVKPLLMVDTIMKLAHLMPGIVTGYKMTGKDEERWCMIKWPSRVLKGVNEQHLQQSKDFIAEECKKQGLLRRPKIFEFEDEMPKAEIIAQIYANWRAAKVKKD